MTTCGGALHAKQDLRTQCKSRTITDRSDIAACNQLAGADLCQPVDAAVKTAS